MISSCTTFIMRVSIALFWLCVIVLFLYTPRLTNVMYRQKSVSLFIWPMILDATIFTQFEEETGIKVHVNYYESNDELYSKLEATQGKGYDIIIPTDYMAEQLIAEGLVQKLDTTQLDFLDRMRPSLMGHYFDPHNDYSMPYYTSVYGLGINKKFFGGTIPEASWSLIFDENVLHQRISMIDNAREALSLAALYLYGSIDESAQHLPEIEQLLRQQKNWVEIYTNSRAEEILASGSCPVVVATNTEIWKAMREYPAIAFIIPEEGSFMTIDSCMISAATEKKEEVYKLINFLYKPAIVRHNSTKYGFCSPTVDRDNKDILCYNELSQGKMHFFKNVLTRKQMQDVWISVQSH